MALYEPENKGPADISRALEIEAAAWETAELLDTGEDEAETLDTASYTEITEAPLESIEQDTHANALGAENLPILPNSPSEEADLGEFSFLLKLESWQRDALAAATNGTFDAFCRSKGKMAETVCASLNELAMDAIGDIILEEDFSLVPDYEEDILAVIGGE